MAKNLVRKPRLTLSGPRPGRLDCRNVANIRCGQDALVNFSKCVLFRAVAVLSSSPGLTGGPCQNGSFSASPNADE